MIICILFLLKKLTFYFLVQNICLDLKNVGICLESLKVCFLSLIYS